MQETGFIEKSPEISKYVRAGSASFLRVQSTILTFFHNFPSEWMAGQWIAAARDFILEDLSGGQHSLSHNLFVSILIPIKVWEEFSQVRGGFHWWATGCAILPLVLVTVAKLLWNNCLTCLSGSQKWFPPVASSHISSHGSYKTVCKVTWSSPCLSEAQWHIC